MIDGQVDYSAYTRSQLFDAIRHIDRARYPVNLANLERALAVRPPDPPPLPPKEVPVEINHWNWGAFLLPVPWALRTRAYTALWTVVPLAGQVVWFYVGARGNRWAWQSGDWKSLDHFKRVQRRWSIAGFIVLILFLALGGLLAKSLIDVNRSTARAAAFDLVSADEEAVHALGAPVKLGGGLVLGKVITAQGMEVEAHLSFKVEGARRKGTITADGKKTGKQWVFDKLSVEVEHRDEPIELVPAKPQ